MKARNPSTGNLETVYVKALDGMPVGTIVDYEGQASDIPTGWETYGTGQIKKTSETRPLAGHIVNAYDSSQNSAYSTEYVNAMNTYSTDEVFTGKYWIDGKPIYRKVVQGQTPIIASGSGTTNFNTPHNITNFGNLVDIDGYMIFNDISTPLPIYASSGNLMAIYQVNDTNIICRNRNESWSANYPLTFIIEYTKTTD